VQGKGSNTNQNVPSFLVKTYEIVNDPATDSIICWNQEGNGFVVKQVNTFSD
jgi:heat shock transcription factor